MMKIEVLGSGCAKCKILEERVREAVKKAGLDATVEHVYDMDKIIAKGILGMPALVVDGNVKFSGKLPNVDELVSILKSE